MTEQMARKIIDNYVASTLALRANSEALPDDAGVDDYRIERSSVFLRWQNAAASLRELPLEYKAQAVEAIDQITA
ncbi:hypothetical protein [Paenibacillus sp. JJ-223]|uniref:hypothetical protein n=1 Tax=Paenibacillus sp. JJ-223 TaxID=2905647 RepID=UPI001F24580A|nr:hypothetical protein [Paenibacillus sp. JJ-223]CAH1215923.1 hypothetical protein PAECIP111890_04316 [Paenibacillus sp. JJ-223]